MRRPLRRNRGQFVIIAALIMAILIISTGTLMYRATTFFRLEPWKEYTTLIGDVELNSHRLAELSLADYTQNQANPSIFSDNLLAWQKDLRTMYPSKELSLSADPAEGPQNLFGLNPVFHLGLCMSWNQSTSYSAAQAHFTLGINSVGLDGYQFSTAALLKLTIIRLTENDVNVTVIRENNELVTDLKMTNFKILNTTLNAVSKFTDARTTTNNVVYQLHSNQTLPSPLYVSVQDSRGIMVTAKYP